MSALARRAHDLGGGKEVVVAPVRAGSDVGAVEPEAAFGHLGCGVRIPGRRRKRHQRFHAGEIEDLFGAEPRGGAARERRVGEIPGPAVRVEPRRHLVEREDPVPGFRLRHHVADRVAPGDRQGAALIDELHRGARGGAVPPRDEREDDVLARGPGRDFAGEHHPAGRRRGQEHAAGRPAEAERARSDADAERPVGAVGAAVAVGSRDHGAGQHEPLLGKVEVEDAVPGGREPGGPETLGFGEPPADFRLPVVRGAPGEDEVIVGDRGLPGTDGAPGDLPERVNRERRGAVRSGQQVRRDQDALSHRDGGPAVHPVRPEDLLGHGEAVALLRPGPLDHRLGLDGGEELATARRQDAAGPPEVRFPRGEGLRVVGAPEGIVHQLPRRRIEGEPVPVPGVLGRGGAFEHLEPEVEGVPAEDVADAGPEHEHERRTRVPGDPQQPGRAHFPRGADSEPLAGDHEVLPGLHAGREIRHQVAEGPGLPARVERVETLGNAVGGRGDLVGVDRVALVARTLRVPENERLSSHRSRGTRGPVVRRSGRQGNAGLSPSGLDAHGFEYRDGPSRH